MLTAFCVCDVSMVVAACECYIRSGSYEHDIRPYIGIYAKHLAIYIDVIECEHCIRADLESQCFQAGGMEIQIADGAVAQSLEQAIFSIVLASDFHLAIKDKRISVAIKVV